MQAVKQPYDPLKTMELLSSGSCNSATVPTMVVPVQSPEKAGRATHGPHFRVAKQQPTQVTHAEDSHTTHCNSIVERMTMFFFAQS